MNHVEQLVSWSRIGFLRAHFVWAFASLPLLSCSTSHLDPTTETGNPPVIDVRKIALVVASGSVRIVGQAGAVSPGGVAIEIAILGTGEVTRGTSRPDGSFELAIDTNPDAVIELRAAEGEKRSATVYVTRGGAAVGSGDKEKLSCMQRTNLASQAIGSALSRAGTSCQTAADCQFVADRTLCTDSCGDALVSGASVASVRSAVEAIDKGLCASFAADGCSIIGLPCVPPLEGPVACVAGQCTQLPRQSVDCPSCASAEVEWGPSSGLVSHKISGCDVYTLSGNGAAPCTAKVPHCGAGASPTLEELISALAHADVQQALASGALVGGPPAPGGMSTRIRLGAASFTISNCSGASCTTLPQGVLALRQLLDGLANQLQCEQPACPPNAVYVKDVCLNCGAGGGCVESVGRCAVVCSESTQCASNVPGTSCSNRNVCEAGPCI